MLKILILKVLGAPAPSNCVCIGDNEIAVPVKDISWKNVWKAVTYTLMIDIPFIIALHIGVVDPSRGNGLYVYPHNNLILVRWKDIPGIWWHSLLHRNMRVNQSESNKTGKQKK